MKDNKLSYRRTHVSDAATVRGLRAAAAEELMRRCGEGHWSEVFTVATIKKHLAEKAVFLVDLDVTPVATFELHTNKPFWYSTAWFAEPDAPAFYLLHMAVLPARQRHGIGRHIMSEIEDMARGQGHRAVRFDAYDALAGAGAFYQKCGYELVHSGSFNGVPLEYYEKLLR